MPTSGPRPPRKPIPPVGWDEPTPVPSATFGRADSLKNTSLINQPNASDMRLAIAGSPSVNENKQSQASGYSDDH